MNASHFHSPRTDETISEQKSCKIRLGSLSKIQTRALPEDVIKKKKFKVIKRMLSFFFTKDEAFPPQPTASVRSNWECRKPFEESFYNWCFFFTGTLHFTGINILIIWVPSSSNFCCNCIPAFQGPRQKKSPFLCAPKWGCESLFSFTHTKSEYILQNQSEIKSDADILISLAEL